jgi:hypothetical protein
MTLNPGTVPAPATRRAPDTASRVLTCLALVLAVMAVVLLVSGVLVSPMRSSTSVCGELDSSTGECLLAVRMTQLHMTLVMNGVATLAAGAVASALGALVVRGLPR